MRIAPATPSDDPRTKGRRTDSYSVLRGGRLDKLRAAWAAGERREAKLWEIAHAPGRDEPGFWWLDAECRITYMGRREACCPAHGWAHLMRWLSTGKLG